ncbi:sugar phosphate isomerase/epimerase family protein [Hymenobacter volaticus]|uniref:Sugar phosphate isomerase/epimerase n=1 Tax=Hymenobacter volaticus TaxID=2932254 RepID=A0ABY4GDL1_9BACT|nr:sugar phosphate isomerase/epimerase [Hymenobacter volaticus]UOQ68659.1 sugar phosphate isomerase/epimerase [Hymenobacter volaticus]
MMKRRSFLKQAGLLSAVSLVAPSSLLAAPSSLKLGLQLYTLRDYIGKDVKGVLAKVAKAGYQEVETYGYSKENGFWGLSPSEFKAVLTANGLTTSSGHYEMNGFVRDGNPEALNSYIEAAKICGQKYIVVPHLDDKLRTSVADFKAIAEKVNKAGQLCKAAGLRVAYHNHDFEYKAIGGVTLFDVLLKETDPALVDFELDLYWVVRAGLDPVKLMASNPKRFSMWHVKDMDKAQPEHNTEVGAGTIDFKKIFQSPSSSGLKHIFMEQEYFAIDAFQSISQSAAYIKKNLLS